MKLSQALEGKRVRVVHVDGEVFEGTVSDYFYPEDNIPEGIAGIALDDCPQRPGVWLGINEPEIRSIEVIS